MQVSASHLSLHPHRATTYTNRHFGSSLRALVLVPFSIFLQWRFVATLPYAHQPIVIRIVGWHG